MKISTLLLSTLVVFGFFSANAQQVDYGDNFIVFEAEATTSPLTKWTVRKPGDSEYQKYVTKSTGVEPINDTYLQYTGAWLGGDNPEETELEYKFVAPKTTTYRLLMRMHQPLEDGEKGDAKNDVFVLLKGNFTSGISKPTSDLQQKHKFWGRGVNKWGSCHKVEIGSNMLLKYNLIKGEEYTFIMSGRSGQICIDYILFYEDAAFAEIPQGDDVATFFPENMRPGLGLVDPNAVSIVPDTATVREGTNIQLNTTWEPSNARKDLEWISTNDTVLKVDENGMVTAVGNVGEKAEIVAKSTINGVADTCEITIVEWFENPVDSVGVSPKSIQLVEGKTTSLSVSIYPMDADNLRVTWSSNNPDIATVDQSGKVTAIKTGSVKIRATSNASDSIYDEAEINVESFVAAFLDYDDVNKYKTTPYFTDENLNVNVNYHAGNFNTVTEVKFWLRHMKSGWAKVEKDYPFEFPEDIIGSAGGSFTGILDLDEVTPTKDLPTGDFYFIFAKFTFSDGNTADKGINPINIVKPQAEEIQVQSVRVSAAKTVILMEEELALGFEVLPENASNKALKWTSSNPEIATVSPSGTVLGVSVGTVTIKATSEQNASAASEVQLEVQKPASVNSTQKQNGITVYPIPASKILGVKLKNLQDHAMVSLFSLSGNLVSQHMLTHNYLQLDVSHFKRGIYLLNVKNGNVSFNQKLVIQ